MRWSLEGWGILVWYMDLLLTITGHDSESDHKNTSFSVFQLLNKDGYSTANLLN